MQTLALSKSKLFFKMKQYDYLRYTELRDLNVGDIVLRHLDTWDLEHVGIVFSVNGSDIQIIHNMQGKGVEIVNLSEFSANHEVFLLYIDHTEEERCSIIERALQIKAMERPYNAVEFNCQHFVSLCVFQKAISVQRNEILLKVLLTTSLYLFSLATRSQWWLSYVWPYIEMLEVHITSFSDDSRVTDVFKVTSNK